MASVVTLPAHALTSGCFNPGVWYNCEPVNLGEPPPTLARVLNLFADRSGTLTLGNGSPLPGEIDSATGEQTFPTSLTISGITYRVNGAFQCGNDPSDDVTVTVAHNGNVLTFVASESAGSC